MLIPRAVSVPALPRIPAIRSGYLYCTCFCIHPRLTMYVLLVLNKMVEVLNTVCLFCTTGKLSSLVAITIVATPIYCIVLRHISLHPSTRMRFFHLVCLHARRGLYDRSAQDSESCNP